VKYVDEYRSRPEVQRLLAALPALVDRPRTLMEICGGQTHTLVKFGLDELLPAQVRLVHGPGCPVCVTPLEQIDKALALARLPQVIFTSYGDMLRVPGSGEDLLGVKARGGDVRIVYSPLDAVRLAQANPERQVVFFAVGFETTAPANAMAVWLAGRLQLRNFFLLCAQVRVPPAMNALLSDPGNQVEGFLAAGHVCTIMGVEEYRPLARRFRVPIVVTGFEPFDLVRGIYAVLKALREGRAGVENHYSRSVRAAGNAVARARMLEVFEPCDRRWRGLGLIPASGLGLRPEYGAYDAELRFPELAALPPSPEPARCLAGLVLQGRVRPHECPAFGRECTPSHPLGAPMVSSEGACSAYYAYRRCPTCATS